MITLYHGSSTQVKQPLVHLGRTDLDFGQGFYLTCLKEQAEAWAIVICSRKGNTPWKEYDMIEGGVADDRVINAVENYLNGQADVDFTLKQLAYHKPNHQICLLNQQMVDRFLHYISSEPVINKEG